MGRDKVYLYHSQVGQLRPIHHAAAVHISMSCLHRFFQGQPSQSTSFLTLMDQLRRLHSMEKMSPRSIRTIFQESDHQVTHAHRSPGLQTSYPKDSIPSQLPNLTPILRFRLGWWLCLASCMPFCLWVLCAPEADILPISSATKLRRIHQQAHIPQDLQLACVPQDTNRRQSA